MTATGPTYAIDPAGPPSGARPAGPSPRGEGGPC